MRRAAESVMWQLDPALDTPGTWKARVATARKCNEEFWDAPVYDHEWCAEPSPTRRYDRLVELLMAFVGGPFGDGRDLDEARAHFADHRYDAARAEALAARVQSAAR